MTRWTIWSLAVAAMAVGLTLSPLPPARADCVYAEFYVTRKNADPIDPMPGDPCLYHTSWPTLLGPSDGDTQQVDPLPDGTPNGYEFEVRIPAP